MADGLTPIPPIQSRIYLIRGQKVLLDSDLAELYQVLTKNLNLAVRRNRSRFPEDFMFQLTPEETDALRLKIATSKPGRGGRRYQPYVFTEQGVAMLSSVLGSERAIQVNIAIMRTFVQMRHLLATHEELAQRLSEVEHQQISQYWQLDDHGRKIAHLLALMDQLLAPEWNPNQRRIGFPTGEESEQDGLRSQPVISKPEPPE
jgi:hypothetical protein